MLKKWRYGYIFFNKNDTVIGRSLNLYGEWCQQEFQLLEQIIKPGQFILDVGANIGTHTVFFAQRVGQSGLVMAFEPQRLVFQMLCGNVAINALTNVICKNAAVGKTLREINIPLLDWRIKQNFGSLSLCDKKDEKKCEKVDQLTIDSLHLNSCHLMKIDVEGMEMDVLQGGRESIIKFHPILFIEIHGENLSSRIIPFLTKLNYSLYWFISSYYNENNYCQKKKNVFVKFIPSVKIIGVPSCLKIRSNCLEKVEGLTDNWRKVIKRNAVLRPGIPLLSVFQRQKSFV